MSDAHGEDVSRHVRVYVNVFMALMALTIATVVAWYLGLSLQLSVQIVIGIALIIAGIKASLVASFFMHLVSERRMVYWALLLTATFLVFLFGLPMLGYLNKVGHQSVPYTLIGGHAAPIH